MPNVTQNTSEVLEQESMVVPDTNVARYPADAEYLANKFARCRISGQIYV